MTATVVMTSAALFKKKNSSWLAALNLRSGVGAFLVDFTKVLASSLSGEGAFCCDFTRALFLTYCATKLQCGDVLCLVLLFKWLFCARSKR